MIGDERDLVRVEPQIESVEHAAGGRDAEIAFQVTGVIPHERGDAVAGTQARTEERPGELSCAPMEIDVRVSAGPTERGTRDDIGFAEQGARAIEDRVEREREIHHAATHGAPGQGGSDKGVDGSAAPPEPPPATRYPLAATASGAAAPPVCSFRPFVATRRRR